MCLAGTEQYKLRPERGGFHTNYYRNVYLDGCTESPTNPFFCSHNDDGLRAQCSNDTSLGEIPTCAHGGLACCCKSRVFLVSGCSLPIAQAATDANDVSLNMQVMRTVHATMGRMPGVVVEIAPQARARVAQRPSLGVTSGGMLKTL